MDQIREDLRELKSDVKELIRQGAANNEMLRQHAARSTSLEELVAIVRKQLEPLQRHVDVINTISKAALAVITGVAVYGLSRLLF